MCRGTGAGGGDPAAALGARPANEAPPVFYPCGGGCLQFRGGGEGWWVRHRLGSLRLAVTPTLPKRGATPFHLRYLLLRHGPAAVPAGAACPPPQIRGRRVGDPRRQQQGACGGVTRPSRVQVGVGLARGGCDGVRSARRPPLAGPPQPLAPPRPPPPFPWSGVRRLHRGPQRQCRQGCRGGGAGEWAGDEGGPTGGGPGISPRTDIS